jgi:hypothetical protein
VSVLLCAEMQDIFIREKVKRVIRIINGQQDIQTGITELIIWLIFLQDRCGNGLKTGWSSTYSRQQ